jgi:hypothetical protein
MQMLRRIEGQPVSGQLVYRRSEYSFDVEPHPAGGVASLLVNDVQIEIDADGRLLYVWGLCPHVSWKVASFATPAASPGQLLYIEGKVVPGVSMRLNGGNRWAAGYDSSSQWLCIGDASSRQEGVAFAPGAVAVLSGNGIVALWLRPKMQD